MRSKEEALMKRIDELQELFMQDKNNQSLKAEIEKIQAEMKALMNEKTQKKNKQE